MGGLRAGVSFCGYAKERLPPWCTRGYNPELPSLLDHARPPSSHFQAGTLI